MTALEIVLTSVSGALLVVITVYALVNALLSKATNRKVIDYKVLNEFAPDNPIVFLGDSLTDFYPVHEFIHDERIVNRGIANETTADILARVDDILCLSPRAVILQCGINDYLRKNVRNPIDVAKNVISVLEKLSADVCVVKLVSLYPVNKKKLKLSGLYLRKVNNKKVILTNEYLKNYCKNHGVEFVDMFPTLVDETMNLNKDYTIEGLHLNLDGYNAVSPVFKKIIDEIA